MKKEIGILFKIFFGYNKNIQQLQERLDISSKRKLHDKI